MVHRTRALLFVSALGACAFAFACGGGTDLDQGTKGSTEVVNQDTGLKVTATISAVSLGDNRPSNVQIAFFATEATAPARVEIVKVELVDASSNAVADNLTASAPQVWNGRGYEAWNESITPGGDLKASYALSTPSWGTIDGDNETGSRRQMRSYSTAWKVRLTLLIDGKSVVLESGQLQREAQMVT